MQATLTRNLFIILSLICFNTIVTLHGTSLNDNKKFNVVVANTISSESSFLGQEVAFKVIDDVVVNNIIGINKGACAYGKIISIKEPSIYGQPGKVEVQLEHALSVDGQEIPISGTYTSVGKDKSKLFLIWLLGPFIYGDDAILQSSEKIQVELISDFSVDQRFITSKPCFSEGINSGTYLDILTMDNQVITGFLDSKSDGTITVLNLKELFTVNLKKIRSVSNLEEVDVTVELFRLDDFESTNEFNWNKMILKEIR
jgi:hypothetical protein